MIQARDPLSTAVLIGLVRAAPVLVIGFVYLLLRESIRARVGAAADWFAPPIFLITAAWIVARTVIKRRQILPTTRRIREEPVEEFDADAAFQRYLDRKANPDATPAAPPVVAPAAAAPVQARAPAGFGRKVTRP